MQDELRFVHDGAIDLGERMKFRDEVLDGLTAVAEMTKQVHSWIRDAAVALHLVCTEMHRFTEELLVLAAFWSVC